MGKLMKSHRRERLYAGTSKTVITPRQENIDGYRALGRERFMRAHDDLYSRSLVLQAGDRKILIMGNDLINIPDYFMLRDRLVAAYGFKPTDILMGGTQNHLSIVADLPDLKIEDRPPVLNRVRDEIHDAVFKGVGEALKNMRPATIGYGSTDTHIGAKYQYPMDADRNIVGLPFPKFYDDELFCLRVNAEDGTPIAAVLNYGVQGVVTTAKEDVLIGGDFHGAVSRNLETYYGGDFIAPYLLGAAGDSDPFVKCSLNILRTEKGRVYMAPADITGESRVILNDWLAGIQSNEAIQCINNIDCTTQYAYFRSGEEYTEADRRDTSVSFRDPRTNVLLAKMDGTVTHRIHFLSISDELAFVCGNSITCARIGWLVKQALPCKTVYCSVEGGINGYVADTTIQPTEFQNRLSPMYSALESEHVYVESAKELYRTAE